MKKRKEAVIYTILILALILSFYFDILISQNIFLIRNGVFDTFFVGITWISSKFVLFFVLTIFFLRKSKKRWILPLWFSIGISALIGFLLKIIVQRARPFQLGIISLLPSLQNAIFSAWDFSFPSFHSMLAFCAVPILSQQFTKLKRVWIVFAILIALSRVYLGFHFLSDVIAGGLIGYLIGLIAVRIEKEMKFGERIYRKFFGK